MFIVRFRVNARVRAGTMVRLTVNARIRIRTMVMVRFRARDRFRFDLILVLGIRLGLELGLRLSLGFVLLLFCSSSHLGFMFKNGQNLGLSPLNRFKVTVIVLIIPKDRLSS